MSSSTSSSTNLVPGEDSTGAWSCLKCTRVNTIKVNYCISCEAPYCEKDMLDRALKESKEEDLTLRKAKRCYICGNLSLTWFELKDKEKCPHVACCRDHLEALHSKWVEIKGDLLDLDKTEKQKQKRSSRSRSRTAGP